MSSGSAKRVLYVHHCATIGGASLSLLYLVEKLDRTKYEPILLLNTRDGPVRDLFEAHNVRVVVDPAVSFYQHANGSFISLRSLRPWQIVTKAFQIVPSAMRVKRLLDELDIDLVHLNSMVQLPAALGAKLSRKPIVWHIREELHSGYLGIRKAIIRECVHRCSSAVIVISKQNASHLKQNNSLHVIYNFVDFAKFDRNVSPEALQKQLGIRQDQMVVSMLGGAVAHKGLDVFVSAAAEIRKTHPNTIFLVAGYSPELVKTSPSRLKRTIRRVLENIGFLDNPLRKALQTIDNKGLQDRVRFIGMRLDVPEILALTRVLVWPASVSHFARPIIEAGAMARPVVASAFASTREIVEDGKTGFLVDSENPSDFASAINQLLDNPDLARSMGEAGFELARRRYDASTNAAMTFAVYDRIFEEHERS